MVIPLVGFVYVFGYVTYHWFTHGRNIMRVKDIVIAADTAGRRGSAWGGALGVPSITSTILARRRLVPRVLAEFPLSAMAASSRLPSRLGGLRLLLPML